MTHVPLRNLNFTHDAIVDLILAEPAIEKQEIASRFGYSIKYVSIVTSSDAFRERLAQRKAQLVDPLIAASINDRMRALTERSLEVLLDKVNQPSSTVDASLALQAAQLGAKGLNIGGFASKMIAPPPAPADDRLDRLAARLTSLMGTPAALEAPIDVESRPVA